MKMCFTCKCRPRRAGRDSMCRECRNDYVRIWKAKQRHGNGLKGYKPRNPPKVRIKGRPEVTA